MARYKLTDVRAFRVEGTSGEVVGFAVELHRDRWAAINALADNPLLGVFDKPKEAYDAIANSEDAIQHGGKDAD